MIAFTYFIPLAVLTLLFGLAVAWSRRHRGLRWMLVVASLLLIPAAYVCILDLLSRPKPVSKEYFAYHAKAAEVLAFHVEPGISLSLWLLNKHQWDKPRAYERPWNDETRKLAGELQRMWEQRKKKGGKIILNNPFAPSLEDEKPLLEHKMPWPKFPEKRPPEHPGGPGSDNDAPKKYQA